VLVGGDIGFLFGLEWLLSYLFSYAIEVIMKNTNADWYCKIAYAWCGNALLWRSGLFDYFPNPNER